MSVHNGKTYWLVGASQGLGRALAILLHAQGAQLIVSSRAGPDLYNLAAQIKARALPVDVQDGDAVRKAGQRLGPVDGVIYNAGAYDPMPTHDWDTDKALRMVDVNLNGAIRVLGETVPQLLAQGHGEVTLVGSLAGYRGLPKAIGYGASKAALISLGETMRFDLKGSGVHVRVVNPGFIKTRLTDKNGFQMPQLMTPERAARHVERAMRRKRFRTDFPYPFAGVIRLVRRLPDWVFYR